MIHHHYTNIQCKAQGNGRKPALLTVAANQEIYFKAHMWRIKGPYWAFMGLYFIRSCPCTVSTSVQQRSTQASIAKEEWDARFRLWPQTINPQCNRHKSCFTIFQSTVSLPPPQTLLLSCSLFLRSLIPSPPTQITYGWMPYSLCTFWRLLKGIVGKEHRARVPKKKEETATRHALCRSQIDYIQQLCVLCI